MARQRARAENALERAVILTPTSGGLGVSPSGDAEKADLGVGANTYQSHHGAWSARTSCGCCRAKAATSRARPKCSASIIDAVSQAVALGVEGDA